MSETQSTAARLAAEWQRIEAEYGPGETALALIRRAMDGYDDDTIAAAMHLVPLRKWAGR